MNIQQHNNENNFKLPEELASIGKENPFSVPKNFFDELPTVISNKVSEARKETAIFSPIFYRKNIIYLFSVCSLVLLIVLIYPKFRNEHSSNNISEFIIDEKYNSFDEDMLVAFLTENEENENASDDDLVDYLLNNNTDINLIMEELK